MALATVTVKPHHLTISPNGINKMWGFKGDFKIPLDHVVRAHTGTASASRNKGWRLPGLGWFNRWVGSFRKEGVWSYWCAVSGPTLEIELRDERYTHLILTVAHPRETAWEINEAVGIA